MKELLFLRVEVRVSKRDKEEVFESDPFGQHTSRKASA